MFQRNFCLQRLASSPIALKAPNIDPKNIGLKYSSFRFFQDNFAGKLVIQRHWPGHKGHNIPGKNATSILDILRGSRPPVWASRISSCQVPNTSDVGRRGALYLRYATQVAAEHRLSALNAYNDGKQSIPRRQPQ